MNTIHRAIVAALIACAPLLAHAAGYKCKQADGSVSYQDHVCAAGTASSSAVPTDLSGGEAFRRSLPPVTNLDATCQVQAKQALSVCLGRLETTFAHCQATSMSAVCKVAMSRPRGSPQNEVCARQALGCINESVESAQACFQRELPANCREQLEAARQNRRR
jgi:hypothetical protein